jgi:hypothetical protein
MEPVEQVNVSMPNVPSSLAKVGDRLRSANVNIDAISCTEKADDTIIHLICDDPETAKLVLKDLGTVSSTSVLALKMRNKPGAIANIGRACAAVGMNIHLIYATTCGKEAMVYVGLDNVEGAIEALKKWEKSAGKLS